MKSKLNKRGTQAQSTASFSFEEFSYSIPAVPLAWLRKYGITNAEIHKHAISWHEEKQSLIFPVFDGDRLVNYTGRYFGEKKDHPKYITIGNKTGPYKLFSPQEPTNVYILVEDFVSAIKVGRQFNCIPILGAHVPLALILSLIRHEPVLRIWLDPDKRIEASQFVQRALQYIPNCGSIISDKDPKEYENGEIKTHVLSTFKSVPQLRNVQ
jgi:hypothetical protein